MTDQEMQIAIAQACGWEFHPQTGPLEFPWWNRKTKKRAATETLPDYPNDLNAMSTVERAVEYPEAYASILGPIIQRDSNKADNWTGGWGTTRWQFAFATATAHQRAEAFLRTIGKWRSEP